MSGENTALLSVYHKDGIVEFAQGLVALGWDIIASGGTAKTLREAGVLVVDCATIVGPPILGHRVVTLSREIHAALLAKDNPEDRAELRRINVPFIDLVCVDLYPLEAELQRDGHTAESVTEMTDIGGPCMLRSAAKGRRIVISNPNDRRMVLAWLKAGRPMEKNFRKVLAAKAEQTVARYCQMSAFGIGGAEYLGCAVATLKARARGPLVSLSAPVATAPTGS